jgi:hypothetical protein
MLLKTSERSTACGCAVENLGAASAGHFSQNRRLGLHSLCKTFSQNRRLGLQKKTLQNFFCKVNFLLRSYNSGLPQITDSALITYWR